jgi:hypothetical protein
MFAKNRKDIRIGFLYSKEKFLCSLNHMWLHGMIYRCQIGVFIKHYE